MSPNDDQARLYDELLVLAVRTGDAAAAERLAARWAPRLLSAARRLLGDAAEAEEAVQDCWVDMLRGLPRLKDSAAFPAWAFAVLRRRCADRLRLRVRERARAAPERAAEDMVSAPEGAGERRSEVADAMARLDPDRRTAAVLYYGGGLSLAELALALGVPEGTAKSRLFLARRDLKRLLGEKETDA